MRQTWQCRSRRQLLRVLDGKNRAAAHRRDRAPLRGAPEWGSPDRLMPQLQRSPLRLLYGFCVRSPYPNEIVHFRARVERCGLHRIPQLAPASATSLFICFKILLFFLCLWLCFLGVYLSLLSSFRFLLFLCVFFFSFAFLQTKRDPRSSLKRSLTPRDS